MKPTLCLFMKWKDVDLLMLANFLENVVSLYKATNDSGLKGRTGMLPWHAIPFLKGLGMLTPNPCQNG